MPPYWQKLQNRPPAPNKTTKKNYPLGYDYALS